MIARIRQYGCLKEAREEWRRLGLPPVVDDERELFVRSFVFVEDADPSQLQSLPQYIKELGGRTFRCDGSITRTLLMGPRNMVTNIADGGAAVPRKLEEAAANFLNREPGLINMGEKKIALDHTLIMGVINVTPDSFSDGGEYDTIDSAVTRAHKLVERGADIIDVGGESTRPHSDPISEEVESRRVIPVVRRLVDETAVPISIDTMKPGVARRAVSEGASLVNDVSGLRNPEMVKFVAESGLPVVVMHMLGRPKTMQDEVHYDDVVGDIIHFLDRNIGSALRSGVDPGNIIIDPGIGFGKTPENNIEILRRLREFRCMGYPLLVGPSRKSFIGRILDLPVDQRLEGTISATVSSIMNGADIVRVHDVEEVKKAVIVADEIARY